MGWWSTDAEGNSFANEEGNEALVWGDGPADHIDNALDAIKVEFVRDWGRLPSAAEMMAGLTFSTRVAIEGLPRVPSEAKRATEDEVAQAEHYAFVQGFPSPWPQALQDAVARLAP